jgi:outer membrane protein assembly factor BamB
LPEGQLKLLWEIESIDRRYVISGNSIFIEKDAKLRKLNLREGVVEWERSNFFKAEGIPILSDLTILGLSKGSLLLHGLFGDLVSLDSKDGNLKWVKIKNKSGYEQKVFLRDNETIFLELVPWALRENKSTKFLLDSGSGEVKLELKDSNVTTSLDDLSKWKNGDTSPLSEIWVPAYKEYNATQFESGYFNLDTFEFSTKTPQVIEDNKAILPEGYKILQEVSVGGKSLIIANASAIIRQQSVFGSLALFEAETKDKIWENTFDFSKDPDFENFQFYIDDEGITIAVQREFWGTFFISEPRGISNHVYRINLESGGLVWKTNLIEYKTPDRFNFPRVGQHVLWSDEELLAVVYSYEPFKPFSKPQSGRQDKLYLVSSQEGKVINTIAFDEYLDFSPPNALSITIEDHILLPLDKYLFILNRRNKNLILLKEFPEKIRSLMGSENDRLIVTTASETYYQNINIHVFDVSFQVPE